MREIKFRGKDLKTNEWVYGNLSHYNTEKDAMIECVDYDDKKMLVTTHFVNPDTIGQYTGLKDKEGNEIYEGDIVCQHEKPYNLDYIGVVIYDSDTGSFRIEYRNKWDYLRKYAFIKSEIVNDGNAHVHVEYSYEVIGNIYDNPELLKKN